ncbi:hypothetical protein A8C32_12435 [Flavivirga aquatica]|uniref:Uncharacterized protein n=1 Tax=Flavivirga aquatica TaxID=1849968 RepID=A0A1E5TDS8_9FLAO|nr:GIY-YIG nuclease family protein [Flavivirga aquatica]OEK09510.1 hypothetical protein A8C32_12435 [Flavivirga aquatica]
MPKVSLQGCSGKTYSFDIYSIETAFNTLGAIYFISKRQDKTHTRIYLGITEDLSTRFNNHHKQDCFDKHNANCISVHLSSSKEERETIEKDILCNYDFSCNETNN